MKERSGIIIISILGVVLSVLWGIFVRAMHLPFTVWVAGEIATVIVMGALVMIGVVSTNKRPPPIGP